MKPLTNALPICPRCNDKMLVDYIIHTYNEEYIGYKSECGMTFYPRFPDDDCVKNSISPIYSLNLVKTIDILYTVEWCDHEEVIIETGTRTMKFPPNTLPFAITVKDIEMLELFQ